MEQGKLIIAENLRPLSVNDAYKNVPGKGRVKTGEYKRFKTNLEERLPSYCEAKDSLLEAIQDTKFYLETTLKIFVPKDRMYTQKDDLNRNKGDCGNYRKCVQDIIFDWLGIDDKYSIEEHNYQIEDEQGIWGFEFTIEVKLR